MVTFANIFLYIQQASRSKAAGNADFLPTSNKQLKLEAGEFWNRMHEAYFPIRTFLLQLQNIHDQINLSTFSRHYKVTHRKYSSTNKSKS